MSAVVTLDLARAIHWHAEASRCADAAEAAGDAAAVDREAEPEAAALADLVAALPSAASAADVKAVLEHARDQGGRCAVTELLLLRGLVAELSRRLYGSPA